MDSKRIILAVSSTFGVEVDEIKSRSRLREIVDARKAVAYFLRKYFRMSSNDIAREIKRSHCVVDYMFRGAKSLIETDEAFRVKIARIEAASNLTKRCCPTCGKVLGE